MRHEVLEIGPDGDGYRFTCVCGHSRVIASRHGDGDFEGLIIPAKEMARVYADAHMHYAERIEANERRKAKRKTRHSTT